MNDQPTEPVRPGAADAGAGEQLLAPVTQVRARRKGPGALDIVLGAAVLVAIAGVSFAVGRTTAPAASAGPSERVPFGGGAGPFASLAPGQTLDPNSLPGGGGFPGGGNGQGGFPGGVPSITGTVKAVDGGSITIQLSTGNTIEIAINDDTAFHELSDAEAGDVTVGATVQVEVEGFGRPGAGGGTGANGTGTATDVTLVP